MAYVSIFTASVILRLCYAWFSWYSGDHARMFRLGYQLYSEKVLPFQGMPISDTNASLPGSLQALLAAIPLYFSGGHPFAEAVFLQLLNAVTLVIIFKIYVRVFPKFNNIWFFAFIILNPWSIAFSTAWNPSYIPFFAALWLYGAVTLFEGDYSFKSYFLFLFPHLCIAQLNLQFLPLAAVTFLIVVLRRVPWPRFSILLLAVLPGILTLVPWLMHTLGWYNPNLAAVEWGKNDSPVAGLAWNSKHLVEIFHVVLRGLSFAGGIPIASSVVPRALLKTEPLLLLSFVPSIVGSVFIVICGVAFFIRKGTYTAIRSFEQSDFRQKMDGLIAAVFLLTGILFIFSRVDARAHRIWFLFPLAFYPVLCTIHHLVESPPRWLSGRLRAFFLQNFKPFLALYCVASLVYTVYGATQVVFTFNDYQKSAKVLCNGGKTDDVLGFFPLTYLPERKINADNLHLIRYTTETLCPYYSNRTGK